MELEKFLVKEKTKKELEGVPSQNPVFQKEIHIPNMARMHIPTVFEHQYIEYISGLKTLNENIRFPSRRFEESQGNQRILQCNGSKEI